jgi:hypothetical protein
MTKVVKLNEFQFKNLIDSIINESPEDLRSEHWKKKFQKAIDVLLSLGNKPDDLKRIIDVSVLNKGADVSNMKDPIEFQKEVRTDRKIDDSKWGV